MDWPQLNAQIGSPPQLRAELAAEGGWSSELDVLDAALDEMARRQVHPRIAAMWAREAGDPAAAPTAIVWGLAGVVVATVDDLGPRTIWYSRER